MHGHQRVVHKALEEFREQVYIKTADHGTGKWNIHEQARTTRQIDHDTA